MAQCEHPSSMTGCRFEKTGLTHRKEKHRRTDPGVNSMLNKDKKLMAVVVTRQENWLNKF